MDDVELRALAGLYSPPSPELVSALSNAVYALYMGDFGSQKFDLFMWKREIPKRKWRRWRGRVKAGKPIPVWAILFDMPIGGTTTGRYKGPGLPLPFVRPLEKQDG